ncbi:MAG: hypothetical protein HQ547_04745 [Candidatus Omnitrophica bacterium]|nr:hypothetical protein [Candidatus Omnitrophota bacterium]
MRKHYIQKTQHDKGIFKPIRMLIACLMLLAFLFDSIVFAFNGSSAKTSSLRARPFGERPGAEPLGDPVAAQALARELMEKIAPLVQQIRADLSSGVAALQEQMAGDPAEPDFSVPLDQLLRNPANAVIQRIDAARNRIDELDYVPVQIIVQLHDLTNKFSRNLRDVFENYFGKPDIASFGTAERRFSEVLDTADRELSATERVIGQHLAYFEGRSGGGGRRAARQPRRTGASARQSPTRESPGATLEQILSRNPKLKTQGFEGIFGEIFGHFGSVEAMRWANIVELGSADQLACHEFLLRNGANVVAVGKRLKATPHVVSVDDYAHYFQSQERCPGRISCIYAKLSLDHRISSWDEMVGGVRAQIAWMYLPMVSKMDPGAIIVQQTRPEETEARLTAEQAAMVGLEIAKGPYELSPGGEVITVYRKIARAGIGPAAPVLEEVSDISPSDI